MLPYARPAEEDNTPIIYTRIVAEAALTWSGRLLAGLIAGACLAVLSIAAVLTPDAAGMGTHTQLGMSACAFFTRTGLPCPACGMTTSFAYFARGRLLSSFYTQPMGMTLALLACATIWIGFYIALTGRPIHRLARFLPMGRWITALLAFGLLAWIWKIGITLYHPSLGRL